MASEDREYGTKEASICYRKTGRISPSDFRKCALLSRKLCNWEPPWTGNWLHSMKQAKGGRDRDVLLSPKLLETLREYWRWMKPKTYLFPGTVKNWCADKPITPKVVWKAVNEAGKRAGISKRVAPHLLRHSFATHMLEAAPRLRTNRVLLGHAKIGDTALYVHLSRRHLQAVASPLEAIEVSSPDEVKRSRRLMKR